MARKRKEGPVEVYAVLVVAAIAVVALVSLYIQDVPGNPTLTGQVVYGLDEGSGIARLPRISMSCTDMDVHMKASQIYTPSRAIGTNKVDGVMGAFNDYCTGENALVENYCTRGKVTQRLVTCEYGCRDGACELYS